MTVVLAPGRVLGIDPSLTCTAIASSAGWIETAGRPGKRTDTYADRLKRIDDATADIAALIGYAPAGYSTITLAVLEGPSYRSTDPSAWDRASLWWGIYRHLANHYIPVAVVPPTLRAMYATGKGNAAKGAVIDAVARRWPEYATKGDDNAADAVALMAMGLDVLGQSPCEMPATHRRAVDRVTWPAGMPCPCPDLAGDCDGRHTREESVR